MGIIMQGVPGYNPNIGPMVNGYNHNFVQVNQNLSNMEDNNKMLISRNYEATNAQN